MEKNSSAKEADDEPQLSQQKSQLSVHSVVSRLSRLSATTVNRVLANIYTQPLGL